MPTLATILLMIIGIIALSVSLVYIIKDTCRHNQRKSLRTLKLQKLKYYNRTGDEQMIKDIDEIEKRMGNI